MVHADGKNQRFERRCGNGKELFHDVEAKKGKRYVLGFRVGEKNMCAADEPRAVLYVCYNAVRSRFEATAVL